MTERRKKHESEEYMAQGRNQRLLSSLISATHRRSSSVYCRFLIDNLDLQKAIISSACRFFNAIYGNNRSRTKRMSACLRYAIRVNFLQFRNCCSRLWLGNNGLKSSIILRFVLLTTTSVLKALSVFLNRTEMLPSPSKRPARYATSVSFIGISILPAWRSKYLRFKVCSDSSSCLKTEVSLEDIL